jgi:hypothetical protein
MIGRPGRFVPGKSLPGAVFWRWEPPVPYVQRPVLGSSVFLYASQDDAEGGANWGGSGVLVGIWSQANPSRVHLYAVTNHHIANSFPVVRLVNKAGDPYVLPGTQSDWDPPHPDGDDIAIRPLGALPGHEYWFIPDGLLLSEADLNPEEFPDQISPGDDCVMVGRHINRELRQFDRPVVRFGNLAMLPELIYQDERAFDQESFLVDMRSHSGFSGSPVFVYYEDLGWRLLSPGPELPPAREYPPIDKSLSYEDAVKEIDRRYDERKQEIEAHSEAHNERIAGREMSGLMGKTWLLGINWGHLPTWHDVYDANKEYFGRMKASTGMAAVVPAWKLRDLLNEKEVATARDKAEKKLSEIDEGAAVLDASKPDEFAEFEDLARKVPKRELDEKRKEND